MRMLHFSLMVELKQPFAGEERILIPSPKVATYDLKPEMSAPNSQTDLVTAIQVNSMKLLFVILLTQIWLAIPVIFRQLVKAIETIDECLGKIITALHEVGGEAIITADHGNAEMMFDHSTGQAHTAHTHELVPFVYLGRDAQIIKTDGKLSDIAPTMLYLMGLKKPLEMTGQSLLELI